MKTSCGAIFYTYLNNELGIILGLESGDWLPFKGCREPNETFEQAAIREIYEETSGLVQLTNIELEHRFASKRKKYLIGLVHVNSSIIDEFNSMERDRMDECYKEKTMMRFFPLNSVLHNPAIHTISKASIKYYWNKLVNTEEKNKINSSYTYMRPNYITSIYLNYERNDLINFSELLDT